MNDLERLRAILKRAIERNDRVAITNLQAQIRSVQDKDKWTEAELRAAWGDR